MPTTHDKDMATTDGIDMAKSCQKHMERTHVIDIAPTHDKFIARTHDMDMATIHDKDMAGHMTNTLQDHSKNIFSRCMSLT